MTPEIVTGLSEFLSLVLIVRLLALRLHNVYRVFAIFLSFEVITTSTYFLQVFASADRILWRGFGLDYRVTWLATRLIAWILIFWMVYALLRAILANLRGLLKLSQWVLAFVIPLSILTAILSARPEYLASRSIAVADPIDRTLVMGILLERVMTMIALLVLLLMLFFILWFPIKMSRNLAVFSVGLVLYFTGKTTLLLLRSFCSTAHSAVFGDLITLLLCGCLLCWIVFINKRGESVPVTLGHSWRLNKQPQLMSELEDINAALARATRR